MKDYYQLAMNNSMTKEDVREILSSTDEEVLTQIYKQAYKMKETMVEKKVYYRGLIELSNICDKDCYYCGIRKSSESVSRFIMSDEDVLPMVQWALDNNYGSLALQAGEIQNSAFTSRIEILLKKIQAMTQGKLGITLSLGEQSEETYQRWFDAGAHRYLLRIETTNEALYQKMHPDTKLHDFQTRIACLKLLKKVGYQVGTGVMIGLPFQTVDDLVSDIEFFKTMDIDMIGMGPYVFAKETPFAQFYDNTAENRANAVNLGLKMIAATRLYLKDVNIAATTALQALDPLGREKGLKAGANILMPIITAQAFRKDYQLYDGKPCIEDTADHCKACLAGRIHSVGDEVGYSEWGDSPHFKKR